MLCPVVAGGIARDVNMWRSLDQRVCWGLAKDVALEMRDFQGRSQWKCKGCGSGKAPLNVSLLGCLSLRMLVFSGLDSQCRGRAQPGGVWSMACRVVQ
jgi:hypothetical protein